MQNRHWAPSLEAFLRHQCSALATGHRCRVREGGAHETAELRRCSHIVAAHVHPGADQRRERKDRHGDQDHGTACQAAKQPPLEASFLSVPLAHLSAITHVAPDAPTSGPGSISTYAGALVRMCMRKMVKEPITGGTRIVRGTAR